MNDPLDISHFARQLLRQDQPPSRAEYKEYRMKLEQALTAAERRETLIGRVAWVAFTVGIVLMFVGGTRVFGSFDPWSQDATIVSVALGVIYVVAIATFPMLLAFYFSRLRPRIQRIREQLRDASILALQGEVSELREQIAQLSGHDDTA